MENKSKDILRWVFVLLTTAVAFYATYFLNLSSPIKSIIWIVWLVITLLISSFTENGKKLYEFAKDAKGELLKVVWPTRQETIQTTSIVMIMVGVASFILWGVDSAMLWVIAKITQLG